jgi:hypothetical protein
MNENKIIIYQTPDGKTSVDVKLENEAARSYFGTYRAESS